MPHVWYVPADKLENLKVSAAGVCEGDGGGVAPGSRHAARITATQEKTKRDASRTSGGRGIRTPKSLRTPVFKTGALAILPALPPTNYVLGRAFGPDWVLGRGSAADLQQLHDKSGAKHRPSTSSGARSAPAENVPSTRT